MTLRCRPPKTSWGLQRFCYAAPALQSSCVQPFSTSSFLQLSNPTAAASQQNLGRPCSSRTPRSRLPFTYSLPAFHHPWRRKRRAFSSTRLLNRDHHFDTLKFVQRLKDEGFSEEQSKAMMLVLSDVIEESIQNLTRTMVLREGLFCPFDRQCYNGRCTDPFARC